ncbi:MAG: hypothetical protein AAFV25_16205 [Bacteroidota bacterium]
MFNFFKKSQSKDSAAKESHENATAKFEASEYSAALGILVDGFRKDIEYKPLYQLAGDCLSKMGAPEESKLFYQASKSPNAASFQELGYHFYNSGHYPLAKIFLSEVFKTKKELDIANTLSIAYARRFETQKAQETLEEVKDDFDFWGFWFFVKLKILNNDRTDLEPLIQELERIIDARRGDEGWELPTQKVIEVRESHDRLLSVETPEAIIRDWHYIQYGSLILDFFFDDSQYVAGGRHVASWGNKESIKIILLQLIHLLESKAIDKIVYANDRDSEIIGLTLSLLMDKPASAYDPSVKYSDALLVAAESSTFNHFEGVEFIDSNIAFSFCQNWLESTYICPDIVGLMAQTYVFPWGEGNFKFNEDGSSSRQGADEREALAIAREIAQQEVEKEGSIDPFYNWVSDHLKMNQNSGHRYNFMTESPVPGSYFGQ